MKFKGYDVELSLESYIDGNMAIQMWTNKELFGNLTVNIIPLPRGFAAVDTNNLGEEIIGFIEENQLGHVIDYVQSGFCQYPIVKFRMDKLLNIDERKEICTRVQRNLEWINC